MYRMNSSSSLLQDELEFFSLSNLWANLVTR